MARLAGMVMVMVAAGCSGGSPPECGDESNCIDDSTHTGLLETGRVLLDDVGAACVDDEGGLTATVTLSNCVSTCIRDLQTECTVEAVGSEVVVTATASYLPPASPTCDAACLVLQANCTGTAPAAGDYTVVYGGEQAPITFPTDEPVCAGSTY